MTHNINVVDTTSGRTDGLNKCPFCGSSEIFLNTRKGRLQCQYCKTLFDEPASVEPPELQLSPGQPQQDDNHPNPKGTEQSARKDLLEVRYSGTSKITSDASSLATIKCQGCGVVVVVNTDENMTARCHYCRQLLSLEHQMPNGAVPDMLLPFALSKDDAFNAMRRFTRFRWLFTKRKFKKDLSLENIQGVYLPYLVADAKVHAVFEGTAGVVTRSRYNIVTEESSYDIDISSVRRDFDLTIRGLTVEAREEKRGIDVAKNTNNVLNAIMPFDIENAIPYDGNYMKGYMAERRDTNISEIDSLAQRQIRDLVRLNANSTAKQYSAGIHWEKTHIDADSIVWRSAFLPVFLYSYVESKPFNERLKHYLAVNARSGEAMGSVPVSPGKILLAAGIIEVITFILPLVLFMLARSGFSS